MISIAAMEKLCDKIRAYHPAVPTPVMTKLAIYIASLADVEHEGPDMITKQEADQLRKLIEEFRDTEVADSWKGGGDPADVPFIERELEVAKTNLEQFIHKLEHGTDNLAKPIEVRK